MMEIMVRILKNWINKFMVVRFIFLQKRAQLAGTTQCITPHLHEYSGHDEDLDAGRIIFTKEAKWHSFHRFQQYYLCFYMAY
jgi:linoleoyl-CoA desaturase